MKVIDLLNKIAKGEEVPKKIKRDGYIYEYVPHGCVLDEYNYYSITNGYLYNVIDFENHLNDEVEIIEEEQDIEELPDYSHIDDDIAYNWSSSEKVLKDKINELIKAVNELKKNER